jgi:hypothetical protein
MTKQSKALEEGILRWFRQGIDTHKIAYLLRVPESVVANALARARENERNPDYDTIPAQRESSMEHN